MVLTRPLLAWALAIYLLSAAGNGAVGAEWDELGCGRITSVAGPNSNTDAAERQYAPDRKVDILHIIIDVTPDFKARTIAGTATIKFSPIAKPLEELRLDAVDLSISSVASSRAIEGYCATDEGMTITFERPILPGAENSVTIRYEAEPKRGLYFRTPEMGYGEDETQLWTQGETHGAPHWFPNYDYPNERFTSEVICRVPREMIVLSNGRLVSEAIDSESGLKVVRWLQDKPHVNYLIALVAGKFRKIESQYRNIPIAFYTSPSQIDLAQNSFRDTADMLAFFEKEIGVPYPWDKYYQVVVRDFIVGGMENTSLTLLAERVLFTSATENLRSGESLIAHELAHQWFGDYVTCKDWSHVWLNEGFAVYYQNLYSGRKHGRDALLYNLYGGARGILSEHPVHKPIVNRAYASAWEQFDYRTYVKGAWVLHMLRGQLGEELFRRCVKTYLERHALSSVVTEDLNSIIEELSGRSFDRFFDQWVYHARYPDLSVSYSWSEKNKLARVSVEQTHEVNDGVMLFHFPTKVRFVLEDRAVDHEISIADRQHDFYFPLEKQPKIVRFDPEYSLLANIKFDKPTAMLYAQLDDKADVIGRLLAVEALKTNKDRKTVSKLKDVLNGDPFYGVRVEASSALQEIHTDEAFEALADSLDQSDARVRQQVVADICHFYRPESLRLTRQILKDEKNPDILSRAISNLGRYHHAETRELLIHYLESKSFRNELADAAIEAVRMLDDPSLIAPLLNVLRDREREFTSRGFASALDTLAHIARNEKDRTAVRDFLSGYANDKREHVQAGAIGALGTLGDPKAIPIIETFSGDDPDDRIQRAAKDALGKLQEQKPLVPGEIIELRKAVEELKKETDKLKNALEDLKKRVDATEG
jgi:aminopeptidase N